MGRISEQFDRSDRDLDGDNDWVVGKDFAALGTVEIDDQYGVNGTTVQIALAYNTSVEMESAGFRARAHVAFLTDEVANEQIYIGGLLSGPVVPDGTFDFGIALMLDMDTGQSGGPLLHLIGSPAGALSLLTIANLRSLSFASISIDTVLEKVSGDYHGPLQELELLVEPVAEGVLCKGYLNNRRMSNPTLEATFRRDYLPDDTAALHAPYFGFGPHTTTASLVLADFLGEDYAVDSQPIDTIQWNTATLAEIRTDALILYERSESAPNTPAAHINRFINWTARDIVNFLGDRVDEFLRNMMRLEVTTDTNGHFQMPENVKRILRLERDDSNGGEIPFAWEDNRQGGAPYIRLTTDESGPMRLYYIARIEDLNDDDDHTYIPREFHELQVIGTCARLAKLGSKSALYMLYTTEYRRQLEQMKKQMNVTARQNGRRMTVGRGSNLRPWHLSSYPTTIRGY